MRRRDLRCCLLAVLVLGSLLAWPSPAAAALTVRNRSEPLPGVEVRGLRDGALSIDVGKVARGAPVRVEVVTAGAVGGGVETTSAVCRRVGGILCVNGDFAECRTCSTSFGGIVHDKVLQRSPVAGHEQLTIGPGAPTAGAVAWSGALEARLTYVTAPPPLLGLIAAPPVERVEIVQLGFDALNRGRRSNQVVLYTPAWGPNTSTRGGDEAVLGGGVGALGADANVGLGSLRQDAGSTAIPGDGMVVSAEGAGSSRLRAFWAKASDPAAARRTVVLRTNLDRPAEESVGGHPVILAGNQTVNSGPDPFATGRNPRTLVGWNPAGDLILATVDGRQPGHSIGVSLAEGANVLRQLGATDGFNLDGGGSSTFVSLAPGGNRTPRVLNRPSDGSERRVATVLAVVPIDGGAVRASAEGPVAPPPPPPPAPPGPPPVDEASTDGLPARPGPAPTTTVTTTPPTTIAPTTTVTPEPVPDTTPPEIVAIELAAPVPELLPGRPGLSSRALTASAAAALALLSVSAAGLGLVLARRRRRQAATW